MLPHAEPPAKGRHAAADGAAHARFADAEPTVGSVATVKGPDVLSGRVETGVDDSRHRSGHLMPPPLDHDESQTARSVERTLAIPA